MSNELGRNWRLAIGCHFGLPIVLFDKLTFADAFHYTLDKAEQDSPSSLFGLLAIWLWAPNTVSARGVSSLACHCVWPSVLLGVFAASCQTSRRVSWRVSCQASCQWQPVGVDFTSAEQSKANSNSNFARD